MRSGGLTMSYSGSGNDGGVPPHAFDPDMQPELFRGVLTRRVFSVLFDLVVLSVPVFLGSLFISAFGLVPARLGWVSLLLALSGPPVCCIAYYVSTDGR